jgi:hypothetical protein
MHVNSWYTSPGEATFDVYTKPGALLLSDTTESSQGKWTKISDSIDVTMLPFDQPSPLPENAFTSIHMDAGTTVSLYVTVTCIIYA